MTWPQLTLAWWLLGVLCTLALLRWLPAMAPTREQIRLSPAGASALPVALFAFVAPVLAVLIVAGALIRWAVVAR